MSDDNSPWDRLCKDVIEQQVSQAADVMRGLELSGEPLRTDVAASWPEGGLEGRKLAGLGLLGRMLEMGDCVFEPYSGNPGENDVRSAARKAQYLYNRSRARGEAGVGPVWILSPGRPTRLLEMFGCEPAVGRRWPDGVYFSAAGVGLAMVVLSELPELRATLTLRLMGRGRTLRQAWLELHALPATAPERQLLPLFVRYARPLLEASGQGEIELDKDEREIWMDAQRWFEQEKQHSEQAGRRAELLRLARQTFDAGTVAQLEQIDDVDELARAVTTDAQQWLEQEKQHSEQAGRRAELLRLARQTFDAATVTQLEQIDDVDELARAVTTDAQQWLAQEKQHSEQAGRRAELIRLAEMRLGRRLTDRETATLHAVVDAGRDEELARAVLDHDADGLAAWLAEHAR